MTIDKDASYYDLDIHNVGIVETDQLVRCILERAGLTAHASHRLGVLIERIARLGAKPGTDVQREVGKIAIEAGMLRDSVLWDQPLSEALAELREIHAKTEWGQMDDPVGELMRMRHGDEETPNPAARIAELERELLWIRDHTRKHLPQEVMRQGAPVVWRDEKGAPVADYYYNKPEGVEFWLAPWDWQAFPPPFNNEPDKSVDAVAARITDLERERDEARETLSRHASAHERHITALARDRDAYCELHAKARAKLNVMTDRYRPRRQSEEKAPRAPVLAWNPVVEEWFPSHGSTLQGHMAWTYQPPAPGEGE